MAYRFMKANREQYTIREMAGLFGVSSGAYYKWAKYGVSSRRRGGGIIQAAHTPPPEYSERHGRSGPWWAVQFGVSGRPPVRGAGLRGNWRSLLGGSRPPRRGGVGNEGRLPLGVAVGAGDCSGMREGLRSALFVMGRADGRA
jgi:hypothetical protein